MHKNWLIWSFEHDAWWKAGKRGYTKDPKLAGRYTFEEASTIVGNANNYQVINEALVPAPEWL